MSQENQSQTRNEGGQRHQGNNNQNRNQNRNRNRNKNRNRHSNSTPRNGNNQNSQRGPRKQGNKNRQGGGRNNQSRNPQQKRTRQPLPLTFWEKILKFFHLYKAPTRPPRRSSTKTEPKAKLRIEKTPKTNTRNAKGRSDRRKDRTPTPVETPRLYLGNLSYDADEAALEELFKGVGTVRSVEIVYNRHTHRSKGFGFLEMQSVQEAKRAVEELHDKPFMGRNLVVNGANNKPFEKREPSERKPRQPRTNNNEKPRGEKRDRPGSPARLHVGNLSADVDESALEELFKGIGNVRRTEVAYNRETHQTKGFGFVEMQKTEDAKRAIEVLHDQPFMGRKIQVSEAGKRSSKDPGETPSPSTENKEISSISPTPSTPEPKAEEPSTNQTTTPESTEPTPNAEKEETTTPSSQTNEVLTPSSDESVVEPTSSAVEPTSSPVESKDSSVETTSSATESTESASSTIEPSTPFAEPADSFAEPTNAFAETAPTTEPLEPFAEPQNTPSVSPTTQKSSEAKDSPVKTTAE